MRATAYVGLGANLGDREATLRRAVELLEDGHTSVNGVSQFRETDPVGLLEQPRFLNAAVLVHTELEPRELLNLLLDIERRLGRVRDGPRFGPRSIDLDLLVYGSLIIDQPGLTVPHPRLHERRFVLEPLAEIAPRLQIPGRGRVEDLLARLDSST